MAVNPNRSQTSATILPFAPRRVAPGQWHPHEIAECYRIIDLLGRSGLLVSLETGTSDEGDPWLVFLRGDTQDVIAHLARIDDWVIAASVANDGVFRGRSLRDVLSLIVRTQPLVVSPGSSGDRVFMHPAAVLAAFVATALAVSVHGDAFVGRSADTDWAAVTDQGDRPLHLNILRAGLHLASSDAVATSRTDHGGWTNHAAIIAAATLAVAALADDNWAPTTAPQPLLAEGDATRQQDNASTASPPTVAWDVPAGEEGAAVADVRSADTYQRAPALETAGLAPDPALTDAPRAETDEYILSVLQTVAPVNPVEALPEAPVVHVVSWADTWPLTIAALGPLAPDSVIVPPARAEEKGGSLPTTPPLSSGPGEILSFSWGKLYWEAAMLFGVLAPRFAASEPSHDERPSTLGVVTVSEAMRAALVAEWLSNGVPRPLPEQKWAATASSSSDADPFDPPSQNAIGQALGWLPADAASAGGLVPGQASSSEPLRGPDAARFILEFVNDQSNSLSVSSRERAMTEAVLKFNGIDRVHVEKILFFSSQYIESQAMMLTPGVALVNVASILNEADRQSVLQSSVVDLAHGNILALLGILNV